MPTGKRRYNPGKELTTKECAAIAGVHRRTIVEWIRSGLLSAERRPGKRGHYRIQRKDLVNMLRTPVQPVRKKAKPSDEDQGQH